MPPKMGMGDGLYLPREAGGVIAWPPTVGPTLLYDLRSDIGVTGSPVTAVADQSGLGHGLTGSIGPTIVANAFGTHPCMRFAGANILNYVDEVAVAGGNNTSIAVVASCDPTLLSTDSSGLLGTYNGNMILLRVGSIDGATWGVGLAAAYDDGGHDLPTPTAFVATWGASTADIWLYTDTHTPVHFTSAGGGFPWTAAAGNGRIGYAGGYTRGDLYHAAMWNGALSATEAATVISSLKSKWGV